MLRPYCTHPAKCTILHIIPVMNEELKDVKDLHTANVLVEEIGIEPYTRPLYSTVFAIF
jgi:hypothetical protein